jgi:hypothetical protein
LGRKIGTLLIVLAVIGVPAAVLRALCVGNSCDEAVDASAEVPFCSLEEELRTRIAAGFREGRSPDLLAITTQAQVAGGTAFDEEDLKPPWPSIARDDRGRIPIVFSGEGVAADAGVPPGTALENVAPTEAEIIGLKRPHPEVRSGEAVKGLATGQVPRLLLEIVLKGVGTSDLEQHPNAWPELKALVDSGAATMDGEVGSLPLDPAAALMTLGTGSSPRQHGVIGTLIRDDDGRLVRAWGKKAPAPMSVIAALGDDLDERLDQKPMVGLVGTDVVDRGAIGGDWYIDVDEDEVVIDRRNPARAAAEMLRAGDFGDDEVVDFLAVVLEGDLDEMDDGLGRVIAAAEQASGGSVTVVVTATGSLAPGRGTLDATEVAERMESLVGAPRPVVEAAAPGGFYLDQQTLAKLGIPEDDVLVALKKIRAADGSSLFGDAFPAIAVSFARYC